MNKLRVTVAIIVTLIWAAGYTVAIFDRTFSPAPELSGVMLAVVTWLFGAEVRKALSDRASDPRRIPPSDLREREDEA